MGQEKPAPFDVRSSPFQAVRFDSRGDIAHPVRQYIPPDSRSGRVPERPFLPVLQKNNLPFFLSFQVSPILLIHTPGGCLHSLYRDGSGRLEVPDIRVNCRMFPHRTGKGSRLKTSKPGKK